MRGRLAQITALVPEDRSLFFKGMSVALFLTSLPMYGFCISERCTELPGWGILALGWLMIPLGFFYPVHFVWLANPLMFAVWHPRLPRWLAMFFSIAALILCFSFLGEKKVIVGRSGALMPIIGIAGGYWLWAASVVCAAASAFVHRFEPKKNLTS